MDSSRTAVRWHDAAVVEHKNTQVGLHCDGNRSKSHCSHQGSVASGVHVMVADNIEGRDSHHTGCGTAVARPRNVSVAGLSAKARGRMHGILEANVWRPSIAALIAQGRCAVQELLRGDRHEASCRDLPGALEGSGRSDRPACTARTLALHGRHGAFLRPVERLGVGAGPASALACHCHACCSLGR